MNNINREIDTKTRTIIRCSCGKKFINTTDIPDLFEGGMVQGQIMHEIKQKYYNLVAKIHIVINRHKMVEKYETYGVEETE